MSNKYKIITAMAAALAVGPLVLSQDAPPVDANSILTTLRTIKKKQEDGIKLEKNKLIQQLLTAGASNGSAVEFYTQAVLATQFEGQNRPVTQFHEWKKKQADHLHAMQNAIRLHLQYLAMTLERDAGVEVKDLAPQLIGYTQQVLADRDALDEQDEMMNKPLSGSIFVKWLQIANYVSEVQNWEMAPGNVDGIFEKSILPEFRRLKDPRLLEYWDLRIQREADDAAKTKRTFDMDTFNQATKPKLLWSRSQELIVLGLKNRAINDMFTIIKSYPSHPDSAGWIVTLEQLVGPATPPATASAAQSPGAQPVSRN